VLLKELSVFNVEYSVVQSGDDELLQTRDLPNHLPAAPRMVAMIAKRRAGTVLIRGTGKKIWDT
jgi:hypothetical protein